LRQSLLRVSRCWELRAAMSLARFWRDQGKVQQAANCLLLFTARSLKVSTRAI
jgi:hypothetical protein